MFSFGHCPNGGGGGAQFFWHLFYQVAGPHILTSIHDKCILFGHFEHQNYQHFNHNYHSHHLRGVVGGDEVIWAMPERKHFFSNDFLDWKPAFVVFSEEGRQIWSDGKLSHYDGNISFL